MGPHNKIAAYRRGALMAFLFGAVLLASESVEGQERGGGKRAPITRQGPSAVKPTGRTVVAVGAIVVSILAAGFFMSILRARKLQAPPPPPKEKEEAPVVIPVNVPVVTLAPQPRTFFSLPEEPIRHVDASDDLPPEPPAREPESQTTVAIAVMEALARVLHCARTTNDAGNRLYRRLQPAFVAVDDSGSRWTVGAKSGTWYKLERGQWIGAMPPRRVFLSAAVFQMLLDLQAAFPAAR